MLKESIETMNAEELKDLMSRQKSDYSSRSDGYIVVNTLPKEAFKKEHIPHSINVPNDSLDLLKKSFDPSKRIIVYCASESCDSSTKAAQELRDMGFGNIVDFEGGMEAWKNAGGLVRSGAEQPQIKTSPGEWRAFPPG